ncbi:MAG: peptidylprolyl isomerase [Pirellulaceae bacterium]
MNNCKKKLFVVICFALFGMTHAAVGQESEQNLLSDTPQEEQQIAEQGEQEDQRKNFEHYKALQASIREKKSNATKLLLSISPGNQKETGGVLAAVENLKAEIAALEQEATALAIDAYADAPIEAAHLAPVAIRQIRAWLCEGGTGERFEPQRAMDAAERIIERGSNNTFFMLLAAQAAFAIQDFDRSIYWLERFQQGAEPVDDAFYNRAVEVKKNWEAEQELIKQDELRDLPRVRLQTNLGNIDIELFEDNAPQAVNSFVSLVETGFYDNMPFHFAAAGGIALTGCPTGDGSGNAGYFLPDESKRADARNHFAGSISMVHPEGGLDSSQFAILSQAAPTRDRLFTVIGRVIEGMDVVYQIPNTELKSKVTLPSSVKIEKASVLRKRNHVYDPTEKISIDVPGAGEPGVEKDSPPTAGQSEGDDKGDRQ